jgi:hypothetical protein
MVLPQAGTIGRVHHSSLAGVETFSPTRGGQFVSGILGLLQANDGTLWMTSYGAPQGDNGSIVRLSSRDGCLLQNIAFDRTDGSRPLRRSSGLITANYLARLCTAAPFSVALLLVLSSVSFRSTNLQGVQSRMEFTELTAFSSRLSTKA